MDRIEWSENFSVGVKEIDEQHKILIGLYNDLLEAKLVGKDAEVISDIITEMVEYIDYHFGTEETYMTRFRYPGLVSHREEHRAFIHKVFELRKQYVLEKDGLPLDVLSYLVDWFKQHVLETDSGYKQCFLENGLK